MSFKNKLIEIKNKYLTINSLTTKFSLYYGIILIVILGISLSMGVIGVLLHRKWHRTQSIIRFIWQNDRKIRNII
mgnify:CR=1 FL=1